MPKRTAKNFDVNEPPRRTRVVEECDVLVCGGGPAGISAAITAARAGANTRLIETQGCLGGVWTAGCLSFLLDAANKGGLMRELMEELALHEAPVWETWFGYSYDVEIMKFVLESLARKAGVHVRLHTHACSALLEGDRLTTVITESKSGREAWQAKVFVDATGDGDLAALAGCQFEYGDPATGKAQPLSLLAVVSGVHFDEIRDFVHDQKSNPERTDIENLRAALQSSGCEISYGAPTLIPIRDTLFALGVNHEYGKSGLDAQHITDATLNARAEIHRIVNALRRKGGPWQNLRIVLSAEKIGVREGRRIAGKYRVTVQDLLDGATHEDAICRVTFPVDVHAVDKADGNSFGNRGIRSKHYDIPLRALIAQDVQGLLLAGRCISGDFLAHASYRVTGNAVAMGEAAGILAALSAKSGTPLTEIPWPAARDSLATICGRTTPPLAVGRRLPEPRT